MDADFIKGAAAQLVPADEASAEWLSKLKIGEHVHGNMTRRRNAKFHRKYFALLGYAFDVWKENAALRGMAAMYRGEAVMPSFDRFRKEIAVLCGFYTPVFTLSGETRLEPKSISFANMSEDEFEDLYNKTLQMLIEKVAGMPEDEKEVQRIIDNLVMFDA